MTDPVEQVSCLEDFIFKVPLYKYVVLDDVFIEEISQKNLSSLIIRYACPQCDDVTLYSFYAHQRFAYSYGTVELITQLNLKCISDESHRVHVYLSCPDIVDEKVCIQKVGQFPSLADLQIPEIRKYRKLLSKYYVEFSRAIELNSHGVGIGSFVYLRRVIEYLLEDAYVEARQSEGWDDSLWSNRKVSDRIVALKEYLPKCLVDNRGSYAILSKGVHELGEDECLGYFPVLKDFIEMVLDEKLSKARRAQRELEMKKNLQNIKSKIATGSMD